MLEEPPEPAGLFVYGTLLFPEVLRALLGRIPDNTAATVAGWRAAALPGLPYPGLVPGPSSAVGRLLTGLTADEWRRLEVYEGDQYELRRLTLTDGRQSWAYVWIEEERVSPHDWRPEEFAARRYLTAPVTAGDEEDQAEHGDDAGVVTRAKSCPLAEQEELLGGAGYRGRHAGVAGSSSGTRCSDSLTAAVPPSTPR